MTPILTQLMARAEQGRNAEVEAWARPRATRGDADAQYILGYLVFTGARVDHRESWEWFRRAEAQGHAEAIYELSRIDETRDRAHSMMPINDSMRGRLRRAAELGSDRAQKDLAQNLATGHGGFEKDERQARIWYERAARAGNRDAQSALGDMYLHGEGGPASVTEGIALLEKVAATDLSTDGWAPLQVSSAAATLWRIYTHGAFGVAPDPEKATAAQRQRDEARAMLDASRAADEFAVGRDEDGHRVMRPMAFANPDEARNVLEAFMKTQQQRAYQDLAKLLNEGEVTRVRGPTGIEYEIDIHVMWSDQPGGCISVSGSIKDYGWRTYRTISDHYTISPDGKLDD